MSVADAVRAVLLLGPTGSGKTPLGNLLEARGLWEARCRHFDFGAQLRAVVERDCPDRLLGRSDIDFLRHVLQTGALLENEQFSLAEGILRGFLAEPSTAGSLVILNGLPRHVGQAEAIDALVYVEAVIHLHCSSDVVWKRIHGNVGGDRTERDDDDPASVRRKLALFAERTAPLVSHYEARGARIEVIEVAADMAPQQMWGILDGRRRQTGNLL